MPAGTLPPETRVILDSLPSLIKKTFPIPGKFRSALPSGIAELSRLLTNRRGDRSLSYLGRPNLLSAYLHYFLPWNLYRLCLLIPRLDFSLSPQDTITDIGCGPLTFASALWIARPDLRKVPLEFFCVDRSSPALEAGKKFFAALSEGKSIWNIHLMREDIDFRQANITRKVKPASLVCAVNVFNETYETISHNNIEGLRRMAANAARLLSGFSSDNAFLLTVEPGVPQSGHFISLLRASLLELGIAPVSPCTHTLPCPLTKKRWCHFAFETPDAPKELLRLSAAAGLPKERLVFSFLLAKAGEKTSTAKTKEEKTRVISDAFPLPGGRYGRYGCCAQGLVLLAGERNRMERTASLSLVTPVFAADGQRDKKSGALIAEVQ
jgi:ribosomal protein RSM22 (predicted rRNA methylase)